MTTACACVSCHCLGYYAIAGRQQRSAYNQPQCELVLLIGAATTACRCIAATGPDAAAQPPRVLVYCYFWCLLLLVALAKAGPVRKTKKPTTAGSQSYHYYNPSYRYTRVVPAPLVPSSVQAPHPIPKHPWTIPSALACPEEHRSHPGVHCFHVKIHTLLPCFLSFVVVHCFFA